MRHQYSLHLHREGNLNAAMTSIFLLLPKKPGPCRHWILPESFGHSVGHRLFGWGGGRFPITLKSLLLSGLTICWWRSHDANIWFHPLSDLLFHLAQTSYRWRGWTSVPHPMGCFLCSPSTLMPWEYKLLIWLAEVQDIPWALHHPWLTLHASTAGGTGWIPGSGQLRSYKSSGKKKACLHEQIARLFFPTSSMRVTKWADKPEAAGSFSHTFSPILSVPKQLSF